LACCVDYGYFLLSTAGFAVCGLFVALFSVEPFWFFYGFPDGCCYFCFLEVSAWKY